MKLSRRFLVVTLSALVVFVASVFLFAEKVHAQGLYEPLPLHSLQEIVDTKGRDIEQKAILLDNIVEDIDTLEERKQKLAEKQVVESNKIAELKQRIADKKLAEQRLAEQKAKEAVRVVKQTNYPAPTASTGNCGDNQYAAYIYGQESGGRVTGNCNTSARNAGGCFGIGQACPGSKVAHCGTDYACQNAWFSNYAIQRYGSWASAYNCHKANGWW